MKHGSCLRTIVQTKNTCNNIFQHFGYMYRTGPAAIRDSVFRHEVSQVYLKRIMKFLNLPDQNNTTFRNGRLQNRQIVLSCKFYYEMNILRRGTKSPVEYLPANRFVFAGRNTSYVIP